MAAKAKLVCLLQTTLVVSVRFAGLNGASCSSGLGSQLGFERLGRIREYHGVAAMGTFTWRVGAEN